MPIPRVRINVELDRPRTLVISLNALCKAEEVTGESFLAGEPAFSSIRVMRALVWAGLLHEDPTLTLDQVGDLIEEAGTDVILGKIITAYSASMPEADEDGEGDDEESDPPTPQPGAVFGR